MSTYRNLVQRLRDDAEFRSALAAANTPQARADVVRNAGLELPDTDDLLQGVAGGVDTICVPCGSDRQVGRVAQ
jgi:hypothetical protein